MAFDQNLIIAGISYDQSVASALRAALTASGMSVEQLAEAVGKGTMFVNRVLNGTSRPSGDMIVNMFYALGHTVSVTANPIG